MAKPAPEKTVRAVALRGVQTSGGRVQAGAEFDCTESELALMKNAHQAAAADSEEAKAARDKAGRGAPAPLVGDGGKAKGHKGGPD